MNATIQFGAVVLFLLLGIANGGQNAQPKKLPLKTIQGTWARMAIQNIPQFEESWRFEKGKLIFLQNKAVASAKELKRWGMTTYKLDPSQKPSAIDLKLEDGQKVLGIYLFADDVLVVCLSKAGAPRPSDFAAKTDIGQELLHFQREVLKPRK